MKIAIYARISTNNKGQDIDLQLNELRSYALARGWAITTEYTDCLSGAFEARPGFQQLMLAAAAREFDAVLVWKLDRFARSLRHLVNAIDQLQGYNVAFVSLRDNIDLSTPAGRLMFHVIGAMAEFERELFAERVRAGMKNARAKGHRLGRAKSTINHDHIRQLRSQGLSWHEVARVANTSVGTIYRQMMQ